MCETMEDKPAILLVDDDQMVLETFTMWLENEKYTVFSAETKEEAIKMVTEHPIGVCLIDLKMKDENGMEISQELKKIDDLLKTIIITGYPTYESAIDAIKMGIFDYVSKSSENSEILQKIENAIDVRRNEIAKKTKKNSKQKSLILVCHHAMMKEGFENFCRDFPDYQLTHTYHSVKYIKSSDFNNTAALVLVCSNCSLDNLNQPDQMLAGLSIFFPNAHVVLFNSQLEDDVQIRLVRAGVKGFLPKNIAKDKMHQAFRSILAGEMWISRQVSQTLLKQLMDKRSHHRAYKRPKNSFNLSNREIEILEVIASGLSNLAISEKLFISEKTVKAHINHIFKKMKVKSRTQAVKLAAESHII